MPLGTRVASLVILLAAVCLFLIVRYNWDRSDYQPPAMPALSSTDMVGTEIVPTLDTPLAESGNAIWCATFPIAWSRLCEDVIGGPLQIANAQSVANRLNNSPLNERALPPRDYYCEAGRLEDGIVATIRRKMSRKFPGVQTPTFDDAVGCVFSASAYE